MLIFDDYNNYYIIDFNNYCKDNNIVLFYIFIYSFYILQLLDVKCFGFFKTLYNKEIEQMMHIQIIYITKNNFFLAFKCVFYVIINPKNIQTSFKIIGLVPYNLKKIINNLDFKFHTPILSNSHPTNFTSTNPNTPHIAKNAV